LQPLDHIDDAAILDAIRAGALAHVQKRRCAIRFSGSG
jgi:hypothetical protein